MIRRAVLFGFMMIVAGNAYAEPRCTPTAHVAAPNYPGAKAIPSTNNLLLPTGKAIEANAQKLIVSGQIVDDRCIPVQDATVELWQMNPFGKWYLAEPGEQANPNPAFAGAGRTVTDGEGNFSFITGFPGVTNVTTTTTVTEKKKKKKVTSSVPRAPQVYIRVKAKGFEPFTTALFFDRDRRNGDDPTYKKLSDTARAGVTLNMHQEGEQVIGSQQIVLPGRAPYRTY